MRHTLISLCVLLVGCTMAPPPTPQEEFQAWLAAAPDRAAQFARFEVMLTREGVAGVVASRELWLTDRLRAECVIEPYSMPPEELWRGIVPALRFVRDYVKPALGELRVASSYRDDVLNACVHGASQSVHRNYYALDLVPVDDAISRERLIETLCPIHARDGRRLGIGLGIYRARRFHIDARGFRGWGEDFHSATFPCAAGRG
ncbi:MAG: D-Ala-D-Ala carboxypeptidase family metallohydrolase [Terricaulis sp.]